MVLTPLKYILGAACLLTCGAVAFLAVIVFLDEWITPWNKRGEG